MIRVTDATLPAASRAMETRAELAMFSLDNLARFGLGGDAPRAMDLWADDPAAPTAILGISREGMVMPFAPGGIDASACLDVLRGRSVMGFAGGAKAVRALMEVAGLQDRAGMADKDEPQFLLSLQEIAVPDGPGQLASVATDVETAIRWRGAYNSELHPGVGNAETAAAQVAHWIQRDSHRFLVINGTPVAMTGFNATLPDIVQVGGVYTPPDMRGRGHARRAVGLHLEEAGQSGVSRGTLCAASDVAVSCYVPLGFQRIGDFALILMDAAVQVAP